MRITDSVKYCGFFLCLALTPSLPVGVMAQSPASTATTAGSIAEQLSAVFAGARVIQKVQISGSATWHAGSLEDVGTVNLNASTGGSAQMQLSLGSMGQRTESQIGSGLSSICQWAGNDAVAHDIDASNCWQPALWFLPALSLQPKLMPSDISILDLGIGPVGVSADTYRHVQIHSEAGTLPTMSSSQAMQLNQTDIGLDPATLLPSVLTYTVHPSNGVQTPIAIEVRYSDYRTVDGAQIPFHITRYVNGSLQLDILVNSAQLN